MGHSRASKALREATSPPPEHLSQADLAEKLGVTQQAVSNWIAGRNQPQPGMMSRIEDVLGIPMRAWTEEPEDAAPAEPDVEPPPVETPEECAERLAGIKALGPVLPSLRGKRSA